MNGNALPVSPDELYARLGTAQAPLLIDVRRAPAFDDDDGSSSAARVVCPTTSPAGATTCRPAAPWLRIACMVTRSARASPARCSKAEFEPPISKAASWAGRSASFRPAASAGPSENKWVTREHPKIDRIACPWLISRFVNPDAEFIYVPASDVAKVAADAGGTPYDIKGVEFGHVGDHCSFDAIVRVYGIDDPALDRLATIVRGADTSRPDLTPQCEGLLAMSYGLSANFPDDHDMLRHGMVMYDALYTWCRLQLQAGR